MSSLLARVRSLPGVAFHRTLRRVRRTRKQARRGLKRAKSLFKRLRRALGSLSEAAFHWTPRRVRDTRNTARRGLKRTQYLFKRLRSAQKSFYFRLRDSEAGRVLLGTASRALAPREVRHRREAASPYIARLERSGAPAIDPDKGYRLLSAEPVREWSEALATCRRLFEIKKAEFDARFAGFDTWSPERQEKYLSRKQSFLRYLLDDEDLRQHPELVEFALGDATLGAATRYLGMVPYLSRVDLMYSLARGTDDNISSQLFHLDHEGVTQLKVFMHVFDIGDAEGPFTFIPADATMRIVSDIRKLRRRRGGQDVAARRYSDEEIAAVGGLEAAVTVKGLAGAGVAVDTSRCLHLGSRVAPGTFRLCLYLQYCTTHELTNIFDVARVNADETRYLAVAHSVEPGRARAVDYTKEIMAGS